MIEQIPDLLIGTECTLIAQVVKGANRNGLPRWQQMHFNRDVMRQFFHLEPGDTRSITLEKISPTGRVVERVSKSLVFSLSNKNLKLDGFKFGPTDFEYPPDPLRPLLVVVEASYLTYRYRTLMPGDLGHREVEQLLLAGPSLGRGVHRRIVTLDAVEASWPQAALRGGV